MLLEAKKRKNLTHELIHESAIFVSSRKCVYFYGRNISKKGEIFLRDGIRGEGGIWGRDYIDKIEMGN